MSVASRSLIGTLFVWLECVRGQYSLQRGGVLVVHLDPETLEASVLVRLKGHDDEVQALAWAPLDVPPAASWLASGGRDRTIRVWDTEAGGAPVRSFFLPRDGAMGADVPKSRIWVAVAWAAFRPPGTPDTAEAPTLQLLSSSLRYTATQTYMSVAQRQLTSLAEFTCCPIIPAARCWPGTSRATPARASLCGWRAVTRVFSLTSYLCRPRPPAPAGAP